MFKQIAAILATSAAALCAIPSAREIMPSDYETGRYCASADPATQSPDLFALCDDWHHRHNAKHHAPDSAVCSTDTDCELMHPEIDPAEFMTLESIAGVTQ